MAHPHRQAARKTVKSKFKSMLGTSKGAKHVDNDSVENPNTEVKGGIEDVKIMGGKMPRRLDRARGGKVKGSTTVNVIIAQKPGFPGAGAMPPLPPSAAPLPVKPPLAGPTPPPGMPAGMPAGGPAPMMRKCGGKVKSKGAGGLVGLGLAGGKLLRDYIEPRYKTTEGGTGDVPKTPVNPTKDQSRLIPERARGGKMAKHSDEAADKKLISKMIKKAEVKEQAKEKAGGGGLSGIADKNSLQSWANYASKNSYKKAGGGGIGKYPLTAGAASGKGRLQHSKAQKGFNREK
jgi:hypothetical protein